MREPFNRGFHFQAAGPYSAYLPQFQYTATYTPPEKTIKERVIYYFLRALVVIQSVLRLLKSSAPFFEQYNPLLKQLPNMYKMIKLIQDVDVSEEINDRLKNKKGKLGKNRANEVPTPTLFI